MQFNLTWDTSVSSAPAAFKQTVMSVAQYFAAQFTDNATVNVAVGFGEVAGKALASGALGASLTYFTPTTYTNLHNALVRDASTADDVKADATLPSADPTNGGHFWVTTANAKALGLSASTGLDGYVGFSKSVAFDYDQSNGISSGQYDFFAVVAHEFSEIMGRQLLTGATLGGLSKSYEPLDLFHYAAPGVRTLSGTTAGYVSLDGGATKLKSFNTNATGDFGDWATGGGADAFNAFSSSGVINGVSETDLKSLDVIGWNRGSTRVATTTVSAGNITTVASASKASADTTADIGHSFHTAAFGGHFLAGRPASHVSDLDYFYAA